MKEFKAQSKKLLDLVVNSIYVNREIFLRELISNASDALDKRRFMSLTDSSLDADFKISITSDKTARTLTITDNGVGMSETELEENLGVIAASGTEAFKAERKGEPDTALIGQFGVGFYSAFMVAEQVTVITKKAGEKCAHKWTSDGVEGFDIAPAERDEVGTDVIIKLKPDGDDDSYSDFLEKYRISALVKKYSDYIRYPIYLTVVGDSENNDSIPAGDVVPLNSMTPVWKKRKNELGENEINDFYKHTYRDYRDPLLDISTRVEGAVDYTALMFVPSEPSFDYYTKDYKRGLSLYCNGVLIMERCEELVPEYLGFIRGVVDTPDLALNISRETLQHDRRLKAIANGLEKKVLAEFDKLLKNDRAKYEKIFEQFGKAIKFGAYNNFGADKDKIKDLLLYYSDAQKKYITFKEYVEKLPEGAPVLYACGETREKISMLPQIEGARENGNDVLYFVDAVDEFISHMQGDYEGHKFENIASGKTTEVAPDTDGHKKLLDRMGALLKGKVAVAATDKLKSYPVCLAAKGDVSLEMERIMDAMGGKVKAERVLQVNLSHPVISRMESMDDAEFADAVTVLYNEALLAEGYKTEPEFLSAINRLISGTSGATPKKPAAKTATANKTTAKASTAKKPTAKKTVIKPAAADTVSSDEE